jgi:hypothetical protein
MFSWLDPFVDDVFQTTRNNQVWIKSMKVFCVSSKHGGACGATNHRLLRWIMKSWRNDIVGNALRRMEKSFRHKRNEFDMNCAHKTQDAASSAFNAWRYRRN